MNKRKKKMSSEQLQTIYLLNTSLIPVDYEGMVYVSEISLKCAQDLIKKGNLFIVSAVGHSATAEFMTKILEYPVPCQRISLSKMKTGDMIIAFQLITRLPEGKVLSFHELEALQYKFKLLQFTKVSEPDELLSRYKKAIELLYSTRSNTP
jgi:hypothetical protein